MLLCIGFVITNSSYAQLAKCKGKYLANVIANSVPSNFNSLWNGVTAENACKWGTIEATRNQMNWSGADRAYNHAKANGYPFRWHTFAWGSQYPSWVTSLSPADFKKEMEEYMRLVSERYPNSIDQIDVVNEALRTHATGTSYFRNGLGGNGTTGIDWIVWCFQTARKYFPNSKLVLNDYGLENDQSAIREMLQMVKILKDRNLIDGFGTQAHEFNINTLSASALKSSLDLMATGGVPIYVTELDISGDDATQRSRYQTLFPVYWEHPNVAGITLWGYVEGQTWKTNTGLLNSNGTDRPAMTWLRSYMAARPNVNGPGCGTNPNTPPTISLTAPLNNASFTAPASITITANASDANGTVSNVQFYNGSTLLGSDATAPYSFTWTNVAAGTYTITARATDNEGAITTSSAVTVTVNGTVPNTPPTVSLTGPPANSSYSAPASITLTATAADANGTISNVQFYNGSTLLGSDATAPYSFTWNNVAAGTYTITARATDNAGATTTSSAITIIVTGVIIDTPPVVSITAPANNSSFTAPASITITANASDANGSISNVQFYNGSTLLGSDASAPYSFTWTNVPAGTYTITARATDNSGAATVSSAISIVVSPPVVSNATIHGPDCGGRYSTITFELDASKRAGATNYAWHVNSYSQSISPVAGAAYRVNIATGAYFTGGQVCVGVNYSSAPWYASYCKTISVCASPAAAAAAASDQTIVSPNPSEEGFTLSVQEDVQSIEVKDLNGLSVFSHGSVSSGEEVFYGQDLKPGIYSLIIIYSSGRIETKRIQKL